MDSLSPILLRTQTGTRRRSAGSLNNHIGRQQIPLVGIVEQRNDDLTGNPLQPMIGVLMHEHETPIIFHHTYDAFLLSPATERWKRCVSHSYFRFFFDR